MSTFRNISFSYTGEFDGFKAHMNELFTKGSLKYVHCQIEKGEEGLVHLQGMAMGKYTQRTSYWQKHFGPNWKRIGNTNKDLTDAYEYTHKEYTRVEADFINLGEFTLKGNHAAARFKADIKNTEYINEHYDQIMTVDAHHLEGQLINDGVPLRQRTEVLNEQRTLKAYQAKEAMREKVANVEWKDWQQELMTKVIEAPVSDRDITVVLDERGNTGKTFFAKHVVMKDNKNAIYLNNGKTNDIMHCMTKKPDASVIFFDLTRTTHGIINYQAIEQIKNGAYMSGKYDGQECISDYKKVVIFTNEPLNWNAMSLDRWKILHLRQNNFKWYNHTTWTMMGGASGIEGVRAPNQFNAQPDPAQGPTHTTPNYTPSADLCPDDCFMDHEHTYRSLNDCLNDIL